MGRPVPQSEPARYARIVADLVARMRPLADLEDAVIEIRSQFPPAECLTRIAATFDAQFDSLLSLPSGRVLGRMDGDTFKLIYMGYAGTSSVPSASRNAGPAVVFSGRVTADGDGSVVVGDWDRSLPDAIEGLLYCGICLGLLVSGALALMNYEHDPVFLLAPPVTVLMLVMTWLGFRSAGAVQKVYARSEVEIVARAVGAQMPASAGRW
jgi:hypothetical protein